MFFLSFHCIPVPGTSKAKECGGAYINVWVNEDDYLVAVQFAEKKIQEMEWIILEEMESKQIDDSFYAIESQIFEYYQQALIDKWVVVIHTFPLEEQ